MNRKKVKSSLHKWLMQTGETPRQYEMFQAFISLPVSERSSIAVANQLGVTDARVAQVRQSRNWADRAMEYDNFLANAAALGAARAAEKQGAKWVEWGSQKNDQTQRIVDKLFSKVEEILNLPVARVERRSEPILNPVTNEPYLGHDGQPLMQNINILMPGRFNGSDAKSFLEAAVILSQFLIQQGSRGQTMAIHASLPRPVKPLELYSSEELADYIEKVRAAKQKIANREPIEVVGDNVA